MTAVDYAFLLFCVLTLGVMLIGSKVLRAIFWETLRHPFRSSRITVHQDQVVITPSPALPSEDPQSRSTAGAR